MKYLLLTVTLLFTTITFSQIQESYSSWNTVLLKYELSPKFYIFNETHFRRTNFLSNWQQFIERPSLHYSLNNTVEFAAGYSYIKNYQETLDFSENNVWEQITLSHDSGKFSFSHRFRYEQRFIQQVVSSSNGNFEIDGTNHTNRLRYRITTSFPLFNIVEDKKLSGVVFDEIWLNQDKGIVPRSLNQNWFYVGVSYPIFDNANLDLGYMSAYAPLGGDFYANNHILQTTFKYTFSQKTESKP